MTLYNIDNESDFQEHYYNYLRINGIAGLQFESLRSEVWLDKEKKNRIDIVGSLNSRSYYYELKDYRKLCASQVYYKLGDLFLQLERYKEFIDVKKNSLKAILLLPKAMPENLIQDIVVMLRARQIYVEVFTIDNSYILNYEEIDKLK